MLDVKKFISTKNLLIESQVISENKVLHILLCFDDNYALPAGIAIMSVIKNNPQQVVHFHLFTHNVSAVNRQKLCSIKSDNLLLTEYVINNQFQIDSQNTTQFPISACVRLIAPLVLKNTTNRLLYIDSDTLCKSSLDKVFNIELDNAIVAAVADLEEMQISQCSKYNIIFGSYFNSGVMLLNIDLWCQNEITQRTLQFLNNGEKFNYPDQDVLNIVVGDKRVIIEKKYNHFVALSPNRNDDATVSQDTVFIHYVTKNKPWHQPYLTNIYDNYLSNSPWCHDKLPRFENKKTSSIRQYSRLMFQQKHYLTAIRFYFYYLIKKLFK
ncbi:glycosyltransferase [Orbaceae bacterium ESL0721]|nr:glycosyltransferase [Orbaceae bacterium ESL0721]